VTSTSHCGNETAEAVLNGTLHSAKPVILIGGAPGTGKTSLASRPLGALDLDHRIGTGFVRAIVAVERAALGRKGTLARHTYDSDDPIGLVLAAQVRGERHKLRTIGDEQFQAIRAMDDYYRRSATELGVPTCVLREDR
jgi:2-phosphoglycerate kinase